MKKLKKIVETLIGKKPETNPDANAQRKAAVKQTRHVERLVTGKAGHK